MEGSTPPARAPIRSPRAPAALRGHLPFLADGVLLCFLCAMWASNAINMAEIAARWSCGEESRAAAAARAAFSVACVAAGVLGSLALAPVIWILRTVVVETRRERRRVERTGARPRRDGGAIPVFLLIVVFLALMVSLGWLIQELAPAKGSGLHRAGSALSDAASFLYSFMACFVLLPIFFSPGVLR